LKFAYVDTSCLVAIIFGEEPARGVAKRLRAYDRLFSSNLLEAELRATFEREQVEQDAAEEPLSWVTWVYPNRPLTLEMARVLAMGYLRGADLWHLACGLFLESDPRQLHFLTLDERQAEIASSLNFPGLWGRSE